MRKTKNSNKKKINENNMKNVEHLNDLKIAKNKNVECLVKLKNNHSSSEDCSIESDIISTEFSNKITLTDGNSDDDSIPTEFLLNNHTEQKQHTKLFINYQRTTSKFIDECEYRMDNKYRGYAVIFNNKKFNNSLDMPLRSGTDKDAANLEKTFHKLGFNVILEHNNTAHEMRDLLNKLARSDHSENDCFVCCILSHGEEGIIYGIDREVEIEQLISPFKLSRSLAGKPKLFFIQACRGTKLMDSIGGIDTNPFKSVTVDKIPIEADFLIAYSTVAGHYSWRNSTNGSWFVQTLCDVLLEYGMQLEIMQILTIVNRKVAYHYESNASDSSMSGKKQIPCIMSMLTKELFFKRKSQLCSDI